MNEDKYFDLRRHNVTTVAEAIAFLEIIQSKLPQIQVILTNAAVTEQTLLGRAEYAEGKRVDPGTPAPVAPDNTNSVGDRLSGQIVPTIGIKSAAERLGEMRAANGVLANAPAPGQLGSVQAPGASPATAQPVQSFNMPQINNAPGINVPPSPAAPITPPALSDPAMDAMIAAMESNNGEPLDLAAIAAGQAQPPSDDAPDNGAQSSGENPPTNGE